MPVQGVVGLEKVSCVGGEGVSVEKVLVDGASLVEDTSLGGEVPVDAVEVVESELLLSEKQVNVYTLG